MSARMVLFGVQHLNLDEEGMKEVANREIESNLDLPSGTAREQWTRVLRMALALDLVN